jgi:CheY-like chemotaxis protein
VKRILIVDDSAVARSIVLRVLGPGYATEQAGSAAEAVARLRAAPPDLVLLDLLMPEQDGFAVLEAIRSGGPAVPVIVLSADIQNSTRERVLAAGALSLINKPVRPEELRPAVAAALAAAGEA